MRTPAAMVAAAMLASAGALPVLAQQPQPRAAFDRAGEVRGPLSDFWFKVRSEWGGYMRPEGDLPPGGGFLQQRTMATAPPTSVWVSLVHADLSQRKGADRPAILQLQEEFLREWKNAEGRNWPYAQIYDRPWDRMGEVGRRQNIIMIGTPWTLPPVGPLAERLGFRITPGRIEIGRRRYHGDNLLLIFIAPNPEEPERYAMVITGAGEEALFQASHLPYGDTDYVLFRGRRLLEAGHFDKSRQRVWAPPRSWEAAGSHRGFAIRESPHYVFWYEDDHLSREEVDELVKRKEAGWPALTALLPAPPAPGRKITWFLYPSVDRKIDETARDEPSHVDWAAREIHAVYSRAEQVIEPYLDLMILLHDAIGPTRVPRLERALALALAPSFQDRGLATLAGPVFTELQRRESAVLRSLRDQDVMTPADGPPGSYDILLAAFLQERIQSQGRQRALEFVRRASPRTLEETFKDLYEAPLGDALDRWAASLPEGSGAPGSVAVAVAAGAADDGGEPMRRARDLLRGRRDAEAAALLETIVERQPLPEAHAMLARARFRRGEFAAAAGAARRALDLCAPSEVEPACGEIAGWSRLTLGRVEALAGRHMAARVELIHEDVTSAPGPIPTLAAHWLATMGESRNQLTVVSHLKSESRVSLRKLDWKAAEESLRRALEIDPSDGEAHRLLSEVYHKQHEYWAWQIRYINHVHPDYNVLSRMYFPGESTVLTRVEYLHSLDAFNDLVLRGNLELLKAQTLYAVEIQNLHTEGDRFLIEKRDIPEALSAYQKALALNEDFFLSHFLVGRCYFLLDRDEEARASFEQVLRRQPSDPLVLAWTHTYLGYLAIKQDDLASARRSFDRALKEVSDGKVARLARDGLGKVMAISILMPGGAGTK